MASTVDKKLTEQDLSSDQREVYEAMLSWSRGESVATIPGEFPRESVRILTVGGYAGVGKSSLLGVFAAETDLLVAYVSYTGRASSVLRRKLKACGVETTTQLQRSSSDPRFGWSDYYSDEDDLGDTPLCTTLHRLLYRPIIDPVTEELRGWIKRTSLDRNYDLIVVDEASMVSDEILQDIASHGVPLMAVGDHGQLPPVAAPGKLMQNPMLRLEKIHRQAEKSPIITLSRIIREGGRLLEFRPDGDAVSFWSRRDTAEVLARVYATPNPLEVGVLCWTNRMRVKLNGMARIAIKKNGPPRTGEPVICLKNRPPVFNGMRGVLTADSQPDAERPWYLYARIGFPEEGIAEAGYTLCAPQFNREKTFADIEELRERGIPIFAMSAAGEFYDFSYACTVHKMQGSSLGHAVWYVDCPEKPWDDSYRRLAYTAVTRASERLSVIRG